MKTVTLYRNAQNIWFLILTYFLLGATIATAQIPNSGFENWVSAGNHLNPVGWWTANDSITSGNQFPATRSTDHYPEAIGNYSIRLENNIDLLPHVTAFGITWTGDYSGNNYPAFVVSGHPTSLCGYYRFQPLNNDTMEIHIRMYKNGVDIAGGSYKSSETSNDWSSFCIPFNAYTEVDSARIMILSCYNNDAPLPYGNSVLYMDNLSFDGLIVDGMDAVASRQPLEFYPNPSASQITISLPQVGKDAKVSMFNLQGKCVLQQAVFDSNSSIDIRHLKAGIYFVQVQSEHCLRVGKWMKE